MVLTAAPPLYELVWSKQKGLSHKSASSSSAEKRESPLWSTETFNIVQINSLNSESQIELKDHKKITPVGSTQSPCGPQNCSATTELSTRKEQISNLELDNGLNPPTTLECSKEVTERNNCATACMGIVSSYQEPTLAVDVDPSNISPASTSRATNGPLPMDVARRTKFKKVEAHHRNLVGTFGSAFNYNKASEIKKDKQPIIYDEDDGSSSSNRRGNGHGNFECISSRGIISTVKRARICDTESENLIGGKKMKWQSNGNYSFKNWVSTITNGLTKPSKDVPMEFFQHPSLQVKGIVSPVSISDKRREIDGVSHEIRGFESIFQDMYCPGYNVSRNKNKFIDHQKELVALEGNERVKQDGYAETTRQRRHNFPKSLWITRYTHRLSSPSKVSVQCSSPRHPYLEARSNRTSEKPQHNSIFCTGRPESMLHLTLSSKYCKGSESMSSTFVKRLESLMHTTASKNGDEYTGANIICLFCGMSDHSIRECTKVVENRLEHYLKTKPLYDRIKKASCFCILCFHLDHWAASCPNVSSKDNQVLRNTNGFDDANFKNLPEMHQNHHLANQDGTIMLWSGSRKDQNRSKDSDLIVSTNITCNKNESECCETLDLHPNPVEDATYMDKMKVTAAFSSQNGAKRSEFTPLSSHLSTKIPSESKVIFVHVRKLRLSRTDIMRWMKSSTHINLAGFFLRLRFGKLEKGMGRIRYHVACINGASSQRAIFVQVGNSTYSVTSRFISNQDFNEDELNTWWFQASRDGAKIPSREDLNDKLQLRKKLEF